jgi:hypothetical protein
MKQEHKNLLLIFLLAILVAISVVLSIMLRPKTTTFADSNLFTVQDTTLIQTITIKSENNQIDNVLEKTPEGWTINKVYKADPNIIRVLLSVLNQITISRSVAKNQAQNIKDDILQKGYEVHIESANRVIKSFYCLGNSTKTVSIMMKEGGETPYIVHLPGYDSYVAGMFEISELDWRKRLIFQSTWRSLQRLELLYPKMSRNNVEIRFNLDFFEITGVESLDTTAMMDFIDLFQYYQADRFIEPVEGTTYDSLLSVEPYLMLSLDDIDPKKSNRVIFYPKLEEDPMILGKLDDGQIALFDYKRIRKTFRRKNQFVKK